MFWKAAPTQLEGFACELLAQVLSKEQPWRRNNQSLDRSGFTYAILIDSMGSREYSLTKAPCAEVRPGGIANVKGTHIIHR